MESVFDFWQDFWRNYRKPKKIGTVPTKSGSTESRIITKDALKRILMKQNKRK